MYTAHADAIVLHGYVLTKKNTRLPFVGFSEAMIRALVPGASIGFYRSAFGRLGRDDLFPDTPKAYRPSGLAAMHVERDADTHFILRVDMKDGVLRLLGVAPEKPTLTEYDMLRVTRPTMKTDIQDFARLLFMFDSGFVEYDSVEDVLHFKCVKPDAFDILCRFKDVNATLLSAFGIVIEVAIFEGESQWNQDTATQLD